MVSQVAPGLEIERCNFFRVPVDSEGWYVEREAVRYTQGSHHVLLFSTDYTEIPTMTR